MTETFAVIEGTELVAVIVAFGGILAGFYAFARNQMKESRIERKEEREVFAKALDGLSQNIAANTKSANENTEASRQLNEFMIRLNGSLKAVVKKKQEIK